MDRNVALSAANAYIKKTFEEPQPFRMSIAYKALRLTFLSAELDANGTRLRPWTTSAASLMLSPLAIRSLVYLCAQISS